MRNVNDGKIYALKITNKSLIETNEMIEVMKKEISVLRSIDHPNTVKLYEVIRSYAKIYLVLEYVPFKDLFSLISHFIRRPDEALRIDGKDYFQSNCPWTGLLPLENDLSQRHQG